MLPQILVRCDRYYGPDDEEWLAYLDEIGLYADSIDSNFLSEICYEHGERFDDYLPGFDLGVHQIQRRFVTALEVQQNVRYDDGEPVTFYGLQIDKYQKKPEPKKFSNIEYMLRQGTWPFPPVIIDNSNGFAQGLSSYSLGAPWYLIEGTHRVSYLIRMLELEIVAPNSQHEILWLYE